MKKKLFVILISVCLLICQLTVTATAFEVNVYVEADNEMFTINIESTTTIAEVKEIIKEQEGYSTEYQQLSYCGELLDDSKTLSYYCIDEHDTLQLVIAIAMGNDWFLDINGVLTISSDDGMSEWVNEYVGDYGSYVKSVIIESGVTYIASGAFHSCSNMTSVSIPDSITSIGSGAFAWCYSLTSITIPNSVTAIGGSAFSGCEALISIVFEDGINLTCIDDSVFNTCVSLTSITIPSTVTSIGTDSFQNCIALTSITIPSSVTTIGNYAFYNCKGLETVTIESCATTIGTDAFYNTPALANDNIIINHTYDNGVVTQEATCTEAGEITYTCTDCGETKTETVDATGHAYDSGTVITEATCTEAGVMTYTCTVCGETYTEEIPATGNHTTEIQNAKDATCGEDGYTGDEVCTECGETIATGTVIPATGNHTYDAGTITKEATCTEAGEMTYTCTVCGDSYTEEISATGHSWSETVYNFSEDGSACTATRTCENDSSHVETATATITSAQTLDPDCTTKGETTYTATFTEDWAETQTLTVADIDATGHTLTHTEAVDAGCATDGNIEYWYCSVCGKYFSDEDCTTEVTLAETVTAATDNHTYEAVVTEPDCTNGGYTTYTCTECNDSYVSDYTDALGHTYKAIVTDPTCTEKGYTTYICTDCGDNYRDDYTDPAGHTAGTPVKENYVPVTATKNGYYELATYCTICGEEISRSYTTIAAYGTNVRETIDWAAVLSTHANKTTTSTVTIEEITITEPVEPGDTETEVDSGDEVTSEPTVETETPAETNPTTGMVMALMPMALALAGIGIAKRK